MIKEAIGKLSKRLDLNEEEAFDAMTEIMTGKATQAQIAAYVVCLRMKGETVDEITGSARAMRKMSVAIDVGGKIDIDRDEINTERETIIDTCGTGGEGTNTFNISTVTAFVVAGAGLKVAKHGNRAVSSACGSADVLEKLGINLNLTPEQVAQCIRKIGIGFLYAPLYHTAMRFAAPVRKEIGIRTIFNVLGPLTNPAGANAQVLGVYQEDLTETLAKVLANLGVKRAFVVFGHNTIDEFTVTGPTRVSELKDGAVRTYTVMPKDFGLPSATPEEIRGGDASQNAKIARDILAGAQGPKRNTVLMNAAAALVAGGFAKGFKEGVAHAQKAIDTKKALEKLESLIALSRQFA